MHSTRSRQTKIFIICQPGHFSSFSFIFHASSTVNRRKFDAATQRKVAGLVGNKRERMNVTIWTRTMRDNNKIIIMKWISSQKWRIIRLSKDRRRKTIHNAMENCCIWSKLAFVWAEIEEQCAQFSAFWTGISGCVRTERFPTTYVCLQTGV